MSIRPSPLLRAALLADAATSAAAGLMLAGIAGPLAGITALPEAALRAFGLLFLPWAALCAWLGTRERVWPAAIWGVIAFNAVWAVDSVALLVSGWVEPTALGKALVVTQACAVALLAAVQLAGLRQARAGLAPA
jgi:hypothetical protein